MAISAEQLNVILSARDREFTRAMERAQRRVERFSRESNQNLNSTTRAFNMLIGAAKGFLPALSAGAVVAQMRSIVSEGNRIATLSQIAGTTAEEFQRFAIGAQTVGFDMDKTADIIKDVNDKIGDFLATGAGPMADFFENIAPQVGVTADQFARLSGQEALMLYVRSLEAANLSQAEMTFYMEAIASDATALLPLLGDNAAEMRRFGEEAAEAGRILDNETIASAREAEIALSQMAGEIRGNLNQALLALAPLLVSTTSGIASLTTQVRNFFENLNAVEETSDIENLNRSLEQMLNLQNAVNEAGGEGDTVAMLGGFGNAAALADAIENTRAQIAALTGGTQDEPFVLPTLEIDAEPAVEEVKKVTTATRTAAKAAKSAEEIYREMLEAIIANSPALQQLGFDADALQTTMETVQSSMESAFMSMVDGTASAQDAFEAMARQIIMELYRVLVVQRLVGSFTPTGGGILGAAFGALSGGATGAASGRSVQAGGAYEVGEHGRELFVPQTAGRVLSVAQAQNAVGGGGAVVVNQTINVSTGVQQTVRTEIKQLMPQIAESAKAAVVDAKRRGGSYGRAFS